MAIDLVKCQGIFHVKVWCFYDKDNRKIRGGLNLSWPALLAIIFWGFSFIATKVALKEMNPFTLLTLRFGIGGFLLLLVQLQRDRRFLKAFSFKDWVSIIFLAIVGISGHTLLQAFGLLYTTAINTGWIVAIMPIFIAIAARFYLGEAITRRKIGGILLGFIGVFLVISKGVLSISILRFGSTFGDFLVLISALTWAAFTVGGRGFLSRFSPLAAITPVMIVGGLVILPFTWLKWEWSILFNLSLQGWISILFLGIFCSGLAYLFWYSALEKKDSSIVGMYLYLEPLVTLIGAYFLLGEEIRWITLTGGGMILLGVYLATRAAVRK
jgi:drug/metabolite transporter (DMT)-like permease